MKNRIAFALLMGSITTGLTTFALIYLNLGFGSSFVKVWMRSWGLAYLIVIPIILVVAPRLRELITRLFVAIKWVAANDSRTLPQKIAFALTMAFITTGVISCAVILMNLGFRDNFVQVLMRSWALAYAVVVPALLIVSPALERLVNKAFAPSPSNSGFGIPRTTEHFLDPRGPVPHSHGQLRYLVGGTGAPLVLLHTVRTQAEHFRRLIPLVQERYTVYALDLPGMGYSEIVPGASYDEPAMRAAVKSLITQLDLRDVTLLGESMGATLALTTAADLRERVRRVVAINAYDYAGGIARSSLLARFIVTGVLAPVIGPTFAGIEPKPIMRAVLRGGLGDTAALHDDYVDELLKVGRRPGYPSVARAVYANLPSLIAARSRYAEISAQIHLIYGETDWSRPSDRQANQRLLPAAEFIQVPGAGHFIALERPDVPAMVLNSAMGSMSTEGSRS
jgi:pimeloyl-ACP methyl ester carboxylesterase